MVVRSPANASLLRPLALVYLLSALFISAPSGTVGDRGRGIDRGRFRLSSAISGEPGVCSGCVPPLAYSGGPVMSTNGSGGVTVTPIFWQPGGTHHPFPARYIGIIERYIRDIAAASGSATNVFSVATEYYQLTRGVKSYITYRLTAGPPIVDTDALPRSGCKPAAGYAACVTDDQLRTELRHLASARRLTTDLAHFYPVFFAPGIETKDRDGSTSVDSFCGYHGAFGAGADETVYANEPYQSSGCDAGQAPNGLLVADGAVDVLSHELNEAITNPTSHTAWNDQTGNEIADMCANMYGEALGSTSRSKPRGSEYNQLINGDKYYTQMEFSNFAYRKYGPGKGCVPSEALAQNPDAARTGSGAGTVSSVFDNAFPVSLPADGRSKSAIRIVVEDSQGYAIPADAVHLSASVQAGSGRCGKFSEVSKDTNDAGVAGVTYTASRYSVICSILAVEAKGGRSAESLIYQGIDTRLSPQIHAAFPARVPAGGATTAFGEQIENPSSQPLQSARVSFYIWAASSKSRAIRANQVRVWYSTSGPGGTFTGMRLTGTTGHGQAITGFVGPQQGSVLPPESAKKITFHVAAEPGVPVSDRVPLLSFESYLEQINSASGSGATLADSLSTDVEVVSTPSPPAALIVLIAVVVLALVAAVASIIRRCGGRVSLSLRRSSLRVP